MSATSPPPPALPAHQCELALVWPEIPQNTGNVARLCVATSTPLHLVRPMGFVLTDRHLKRSAMDYWPRLRLTIHDDLQSFRNAMQSRRCWLFDSAGRSPLWSAEFADGDVLVFGNESKGLPPTWLEADPARSVAIPQSPGERCLNLSTSCGIGLYGCLARFVV